MNNEKARRSQALSDLIIAASNGEITEQVLLEAINAMTPPAHPPGCGCMSCATSAFSYAPQFTQDPDPPHGRILHRIGRITLSVYVYRKQKIYEVLYDGKLIASARDWPKDAIAKARGRMPPKPTKKHVGEILAYRGWNLMGDLLVPLSRMDDYDSWQGPVAVASELNENGHNGLYAVKIEYSRLLLAGYHPAVHGIVGLSGRVIEHERGYRAQRMIVRILRVVPPVGDIIIKALEDRYQCQVFRQKKR